MTLIDSSLSLGSAPLDDVLELCDSGTWGDEGTSENASPVLRSTNIQDDHLSVAGAAWRRIPKADKDRRRLRDGDIIVTKSSGSEDHIGKSGIFVDPNDGHDYYFSNFMLRLRARGDRLDPRWLFYWLTSSAGRAQVSQMNSTTSGLRNISVPLYRQQRIPLPTPDDTRRSLAEQKRIAAILDKADAIRRKRRDAAELARTLVQASFYDFFGDASAKSTRWERIKMGELLSTPPNYGSMVVPADQQSESAPWLDLRVINIQNARIDLSDRKYVRLDDEFIDRHAVRDGDLLLARAIGSPEQLGKCIIARPGLQKWAFDSHLMRIRFDVAKAEPEYIHAFLESPGGRHEFLKHSRRSAVQYNINTKELAQISVPLPPIERQRQFIRVTGNVRDVVSGQDGALTAADSLFNSLVQRAFRGEL